jgi:hypothetical protein
MPVFANRSVAQARAALEAGRPEVAEDLIAELRYDNPAAALGVLREIARGYAIRGRQYVNIKASDPAWASLAAAEALNTGETTVGELRDDLYRLGLAECRAALDAGDPLRVLQLVQSLRDRRCTHPQLAKLESLAAAWVTARDHADRGDFALARQTLDQAREKFGFLTLEMDEFQSAIATRQTRFASAFAELAKAVGEHRLQDAMRWADDTLVAAPSHKPARQYRDDVWDKLKPLTKTYHPSPSSAVGASAESIVSLVGGAGFAGRATTQPRTTMKAAIAQAPAPQSGLPKRFYLWVDGGGGYLVCTGSHVTIGQAGTEAPIDVPIFADLARLHATLIRDAEGYMIESSRGVSVNGETVSSKALKPGDRITLGSSCQLLFTQPSPLTPTARLDLVSGHRFQTAVDAVLLMADVLVLGAGDEPHVPIGTDKVLSLYRGPEGIALRCPGPFRVDAFAFQERANLRMPANVVGDKHEFTFHLEPAVRG